MSVLSEWVPADPSFGELSSGERRRLVRVIADQVGTQVASLVQAGVSVGRPLSSDGEKVASSTEIQRALRVENERRLRAGLAPFSDGVHQSLHDAVIAHVYGLGELDELWNHPDVEEIDLNGPFDVFATFVGGCKKRCPPVAESQDEFLDLIRRAARTLGHVEVEFDARHPYLDLSLPDGSRLFALYGGRGNSGIGLETYVSIRRHRFPNPSRHDLVRLGLWPARVGEFVIAAVAAGENVIVSGDWASGKTTTLRTICLEGIQPWERVLTVEAGITELSLARSGKLENVVEVFSRPPGAEGDGEISVGEILERATRRLNPTRGFVGEVMRGSDVAPMLDMFTASTRGSGCTIHARSSRGALRRFEYYGRAANPPLDAEMVRIGLADAAPIVVHLAGDESVEGEIRRYCTSILEVTGLEDGQLASTELWGLDAAGRLVPRHALSADKRTRLVRAGWDWAVDGWAADLPQGVERR